MSAAGAVAPDPAQRTGFTGRRYAGLGTSRLFIGFMAVLALQAAFNLGGMLNAAAFPDPGNPQPDQHLPLRIIEWVILLVVDAAVIVVTLALGNHLPTWLFWMFVAALALVVLIDLVAGWDSLSQLRDHSYAHNPAAALSAGSTAIVSLLIAVTTRSTTELVTTTLALTALLLVGFALDGGFTAAAAANTVLVLCQVCLIPLVMTLVMADFRALVRREVEQTLSHSTLTAPRLTVAREQSEQLARLDLAAESLLAAVADARLQLPLNPEIAKRAGQLATELRLHLLESRSRTWLDLAIAESAILKAAVQVEDPSSSAGLLNTRQRGALLSALWILTDARRRRRRGAAEPIAVEIASPTAASEPEGFSSLLITVTVPHASRASIDPGAWEHFAQVGRYFEANAGHGLAVEIRSLVATAGRVPPGRGTNRG